MKLTWDSEVQAWVGDVSRAGPAGTAATTLGGIEVEFDRIDAGRIVSLVIPADHLSLFGGLHPELAPPPDNAEIVVDVDLSDTTLWLVRDDLAQAAELAADAERLAASGERNAAAIANAELADVLRALEDLAPMDPEEALERVPALMHGDPPLIEESVVPLYDALMERNLAAAPDRLRQRLRAVAQADPWIRRSTVPDREPVFAGEPPPRRPADQTDLLTQVETANGLGWRALRAEQGDAADAARAWRHCAQAWLDLDETGRAAIALDRAADAASLAGKPQAAGDDRRRARDIAPLWALPALGGRTGRPHRPLWTYSPTIPDRLPTDEPASEYRAVSERPYVFISYAHADQSYVEGLVASLERAGVACSYRRGGGGTVDPRIDACAALVVVMSPAAEASELVNAEIRRAQARGRPVRPILVAGLGLRSLRNLAFERGAPGRPPSPQFVERLRADLGATTVPPGRQARLLGHGFPPQNPHFRGRETTLAELADRLAERRAVTVQARSGSAGVGKSALAAQYAYGHRPEYEYIAWVDAERPELIAHQVAALASPAGVRRASTITGTAQATIAALARADERWLIVFDNARRPEHVQPWLPRPGTADTIVTSRHGGWESLTSATVAIGPMSRDDGIRLLRARVSTLEPEVAGGIVELLNSLPLALEQAAGHLVTSGVPGGQYLAELRDQVQRVQELGHRAGTAEHAIHAVWDLVRPRLHDENPAGERLLRLCSFLGPAPIPRAFYTRYTDLLPSGLAEVARDEARFAAAVDDLVARSLVREGADGLTVHELLAAAVGRRMTIEERQSSAATVRDLLDRHLRHSGDRDETGAEDWPALLPHMLSVAERERDLPDRDRASLLAQAGDYLRTQGEPEARPLLERALRLDEAIDPNDPVVARRLNSLALLYKDVDGQPEAAQPLLERALRIDEAFYGGNHPQVASDLRGLAEVFDELGEAEAARSLDARATNILRDRTVNKHENPPDPRHWDGP